LSILEEIKDMANTMCIIIYCSYGKLRIHYIAVTHTKRIDRNLLRKETSFVCVKNLQPLFKYCSNKINVF